MYIYTKASHIMKWLFLILPLLGHALTYHSNCSGIDNTTGLICTNVSCTDTTCDNNTCVYGFYNTTEDCVDCRLIRDQYRQERCCDRYSVTSSPFSKLLIDSIFVNDTGTVMIRYTPPRDICHHLWTEYGKCPDICNTILVGDFCYFDVDCYNPKSCRDFCCYIHDSKCETCANQTGYCDECVNGTAFNYTGNYLCEECPSYTFLNSQYCYDFSNCTTGQYIIQNETNRTDRVCETVPYGTFTNTTNAHKLINWTACVNETWSIFAGNTTHDVLCTEWSNCTQNYTWIEFTGNNTRDLVCTNHTTCENYTYLGNKTRDAQCNNTL